MPRENPGSAVSPPTSSAPPPAPAGPVPALAPAPVLPGLARAFRRRWLAASTLGLVAGLAVGSNVWVRVPERCGAEVRLHLDRQAGPAADAEAHRFQQAQAALARSPAVLEAALRVPEVADLPEVRAQEAPLAWLQGRVSVEAGPTPDDLRVRVRDAAGADEACILARAVAAAYLAEAAARRRLAAQHLRDEQRRAQEDVGRKRERLSRLEDPCRATADKDWRQARLDLHLTRSELDGLEKCRAGVVSLPAPESAVLAHLKEDAAGRELLGRLDAVEDQIQKVIRISARHDRDPSLPEFYGQREALRQKLAARRQEVLPRVERQVRDRAREELDGQAARLRARVVVQESLEKSLGEEVRSLGGPVRADDAKVLRNEIAADETKVQRLAAEVRSAEQAGVSWPGEAIAVGSAEPGRRLQLAGLSGGGACALLILAVCWRDFRARRVTASSDLSRSLGLPVVASIPAAPRDPAGQGWATEAVDALRTLLLRESSDGPRLVMITSAAGGEGKTSLAAALASSLARAWRKTLLIDGDLRKPEAHALFELPLEPGLSELLRGEADVADVVQPTGVSRLWMVPAGRWDAHAIGALAQEGSGHHFERLLEEHDAVVLDGPPVLPAAHALLLSQHAGTVLLAVRSGVSRLPVVHAAWQRLAALGVPISGAVLLGPDGDLGARTLASPRKMG